MCPGAAGIFYTGLRSTTAISAGSQRKEITTWHFFLRNFESGASWTAVALYLPPKAELCFGSALGPVLKPTGFLPNCKHVARELSKICPRNHEHVPLLAGRAAAAAIYPHHLCCAICKGLAMQLQEDDGRRVDSPLLGTMGLTSLSYSSMEATRHMIDKDRSDNRPDAQKIIDGHSSVGEQVVNFVQQASGEAVQPNVLQTVTSMLCSVVNGSLKQACVNCDFDVNMIQMEVGGEEHSHGQILKTKIEADLKADWKLARPLG